MKQNPHTNFKSVCNNTSGFDSKFIFGSGSFCSNDSAKFEENL